MSEVESKRFAIHCSKCGLLEVVPHKVKAILQSKFYLTRHDSGDEHVFVFDRRARVGEPNFWLVLEEGLLTVGRQPPITQIERGEKCSC